jgi:hypothetical protein
MQQHGVSADNQIAIPTEQPSDSRQSDGKPAGKSSGSSFFILSSVSKDTDADASGTALQKTFSDCLAYLVQQGESEKHARSQLGQWRRDHGDVAVHRAVEQARARSVSNPIPYIRACLQGAGRVRVPVQVDGWEAQP